MRETRHVGLFWWLVVFLNSVRPVPTVSLPASVGARRHVEETWLNKQWTVVWVWSRAELLWWSPHLRFQLFVVIGGEGDAAVLRDVHVLHDLHHPLSQFITLVMGQQPVQNHVAVLHVLSRGKETNKGSVSVQCQRGGHWQLTSAFFCTKRQFVYIRGQLCNIHTLSTFTFDLHWNSLVMFSWTRPKLIFILYSKSENSLVWAYHSEYFLRDPQFTWLYLLVIKIVILDFLSWLIIKSLVFHLRLS